MKPNNELLNTFFLPDLCKTRSVVMLLAVTESLVLALVLLESGLEGFSLQRFFLVSTFVQWVAMLSVACLCQARAWLARCRTSTAMIFALVLVGAVCLLVSVLTEQLLFMLGLKPLDWFWVLRNTLISLIFAAMALRYFYVQSLWRSKTQAELKSRLSALQANIRPHFFFNTLNTVASLIHTDPDAAEEMLLDLADLFRAVLKPDAETVQLKDEIVLAKRYLSIEQTRLGERLQVHWHEDEGVDNVLVPSLLLQPLLENAVYHGIQPSTQPGYISITMTRVDDSVRIDIQNSKTHANPNYTGHGMAQKNTQSRLLAMFGERASIRWHNSDELYRVELTLPHAAAST